MTRLLLVVAMVATSVPGSVRAQGSVQGPVVVTQGEAIVKRAPDRAWLTIATETREGRAPDARRRSAEGMTALQAALKATGLPANAITTTGFTLVPEMDWKDGRGTVRGYVVRNQIEVRVDDLDRLGDLIEAANSSRSTTVSVTGPRFVLRDEAAAEHEALGLAVQSAMARAQAIAAGARRTLGTIVRIEERSVPGFEPNAQLMVRSMAKADVVETPITPGELEVRATVTLTVELR